VSTLSESQLSSLLEKQNGWCVSIFMPTHRAGPATQQDPIRFKNLLREAKEHLLASGLRAPQVKRLLKPAQRLMADSLFWQHQSDGIAMFLSHEMFHYYRLPFVFEELVVVADRFHVKPLLSFLSGDGQFYILALSQNEAKLFQGTRYNVSEIELERAPVSLAETLALDDPEKQLQHHISSTPGARGQHPAVFHGHGIIDENKKNILRYFRQIDHGLQAVLRDEQAPLVLAGVEYLLAVYRKANTYPHLMDEGIRGNPERLTFQDFHARAWEIVQPHFLKAQEEQAVTQYKAIVSAGSEQASSDLRKVISAALY
jgi:hypothetical protein